MQRWILAAVALGLTVTGAVWAAGSGWGGAEQRATAFEAHVADDDRHMNAEFHKAFGAISGKLDTLLERIPAPAGK